MDEKTREAIASLRATAASLGWPLHHLSDEELLEGTKRLGETISRIGFSAEAAGAAFNAFAGAFDELPEDVRCEIMRRGLEDNHG